MIENYESILEENESLYALRILLRKFTMDDCEDLLEFGSDEQTLKYLVWAGLASLEEAKVSITDYYTAAPGRYAIELLENHKCIGSFSLRVDANHEKADFGYALNRNYWNKGYMSEALNSIITLCFHKLDLNRVEATYYIGNEASGKVMRKCGMKYEGTGIGELKIKGVFRDVVHMGITHKEWVKRTN